MKIKILLFILICFQTINIFAFKLTPIIADFEETGRNSTKTFTIENTGDSSVAIKVSVYTRFVDLDGNENRELANKDFLVYPGQMIIEPKSKKSVRVKWLGKKKVETELAYRLIAEQLPVNLEKDRTQGTNLNIMLKYVGSIYILPVNVVGEHNILVESFQKIKDESTLESYAHLGERGLDVLELIVSNQGNKHCVIKNYNIKVKSTKAPLLEYTDQDFPELISQNLLAGSSRRILIPWSEDFKGDIEYVQFTYESM